MAVHDTGTVEEMLTVRDRLPPQRYVCRLLDSKFEPSKSGNPMVTLEAEICLGPDGQETVKVNGETKVIAGVSINPQYFPLIVMGDDGQRDTIRSLKAYKRYQDFLKRLGFTKEAETLDDENPFIPAKGFVYNAILGPEVKPRLQDPTPEELAKGAKVGKPILVDGKPVNVYLVRTNDILGPSSVEINRPF